MPRTALLVLLSACATASDLMHVPILVHHSNASHAVAGALVAVGASYFMDRDTPFPRRVATNVGLALMAGTFKEFVLDQHPHVRQIAPWGLGAAVVSIAYEVRW